GHCRSLDRRDYRLRQFKPRRPKGTAWRGVCAGGERQAIDDMALEGLAFAKRAGEFEIPAGAERAALAPQHGDACRIVGVEFPEGLHQRVRAVGVHRVARFRKPAVDDGPHRTLLFDPDHFASSLTVLICVQPSRSSTPSGQGTAPASCEAASARRFAENPAGPRYAARAPRSSGWSAAPPTAEPLKA